MDHNPFMSKKSLREISGLRWNDPCRYKAVRCVKASKTAVTDEEIFIAFLEIRFKIGAMEGRVRGISV